jgi:hypothetical protein
MYFYVYVVGRASKEIWSGPNVVSRLKRKLASQVDMLDYAVSFIDTVGKHFFIFSVTDI